MENAKSTGSSPVGSEAIKKRAPYTSPHLRVFGAVSQLTAGRNNGSYADRTSKVMRNP